jgi:hypothetical protein
MHRFSTHTLEKLKFVQRSHEELLLVGLVRVDLFKHQLFEAREVRLEPHVAVIVKTCKGRVGSAHYIGGSLALVVQTYVSEEVQWLHFLVEDSMFLNYFIYLRFIKSCYSYFSFENEVQIPPIGKTTQNLCPWTIPLSFEVLAYLGDEMRFLDFQRLFNECMCYTHQ